MKRISALKIIVFFAIFLLLSDQLLAQKLLRGTVYTEIGHQPLQGVTVVLKGTRSVVTTDGAGNFSISAPANGVLVFSAIGHQSLEVPVRDREKIEVVLAETTAEMQGVVVTALGIKRESKRLGYAVASVTPDQIAINRTTNFMNALQGKMAGVNITTLGSGPAGTSKIRIRGQSSLSGQNNPLIVVNGIPIDNTNFGVNPNNFGVDPNAGSSGSSGNTGGFNKSDGGDGLLSVNPDDIESMTVLKGATAAALYGSRAKDGVVMITTKSRGAKGFNLQYNTNFTVDVPLDFTDFQYEYGQGENGIRPTTPNPTSGIWSFGERFQPGMTQVLFDNITVPYEPVRNRIRKFYRNGTTFSNTISIANGGDKGGFNLSLSNMDNKGIVENSNFNRKSINLGFTQNITSKLLVSGNINYSNEKNINPPIFGDQELSTATAIFTVANSMPLNLLKEKRLNAAGNEFVYSRFFPRTNPYFSVSQRFDEIIRDRIFGNITARYQFADWLYLQGRIGQDYYSRSQRYNRPTGMAHLVPAPSGFSNGEFVQEERRFREINADFLVGAERRFGVFGLNITAGGNDMYRRSELTGVGVQDFVIRGLYTIGNGRVRNPYRGFSERSVRSLYGAAEGSFKDFLFINVTARNDWFSTLSRANRSILYPSVSGSFVFTQAFGSLFQWLNYGKIRAAYAQVGSDTDVPPYANNLFYRIDAQQFVGGAGAPQPVAYINTGTVPNLDLRPMQISEKELGLELRLLNSRVNVDVAYYTKLTKDQILAAQVSDASGYVSKLINVGESKNSGFEWLLDLAPIRTKDFQWNFTINGAYNETEVLKLGLNPGDKSITVGAGVFTGGELRHEVGKPMGQLYTFGYLLNAKGQQVFEAGRPLRTPAQVSFGSAIPKHTGGFSNTFNYRGLNFSFLVDYKLGHNMISFTNMNAWRHGLHKGTLPGRDVGYVIGDGVTSNGQNNTVRTPVQMYYETVRNLNMLEEFVYNAGFWKLRQVTLGYDFTKLLPSKLFIKGVRLHAVANNVAILKKWVPNIDPESFGFTSDNLMGLESTGLPTTRNIGFNLNVRF